MINIDNMTVDQINDLIEELKNKLEFYTHTKEAICNLIAGNRKNITCPKCHSFHIVKNGKTNNKQNYKCKDCNKKFNGLTGTLFSGLNLNYSEAEILFEHVIDCVPIRKTAALMKKSTKTIFILRHKIMDCICNITNAIKLSGKMELDEMYLSINLKGTKKKNMPRASKKRSTICTGTRGITRHKECITSGIDEHDNVFLTLAGTGEVTSKMIKETVAVRIENSSSIITDCKSSYESIAKENNWNLIQIKAKGHVDNKGNSLASINNIHQQLEIFLSNFRGVSSKHLQQYLDLFTFIKTLNWKIEYVEQQKFVRNTLAPLSTNIKYKNVYDNHSVLNFLEIYADYNYHPSNCTT